MHDKTECPVSDSTIIREMLMRQVRNVDIPGLLAT